MQHLNNICLNFHCEIFKIERMTINIGRRAKKSCFVVYIITRNIIIWNKKFKVYLLKEMFLEVTLGGVFFDFLAFRGTWKPKNCFSLRKSANLLF